MIAVYIILGLFYITNVTIFSIIHIKKTKKDPNTSNNDGLISLFSEPLLTNKLDQFV
jgi:hypothetical protein